MCRIDGDDRGAADARLIAAAPDLLAALERVVDWIEDDFQGFDELETEVAPMARAAIKKARGDRA